MTLKGALDKYTGQTFSNGLKVYVFLFVFSVLSNNTRYSHAEPAAAEPPAAEPSAADVMLILAKNRELERSLFERTKELTELKVEHAELQAKHAELQVKHAELNSSTTTLRTQLVQFNAQRKVMLNELLEFSGNIRVFARMRPQLHSEQKKQMYGWSLKNNALEICRNELKGRKKEFSFDKFFSPNINQEEIFEEVAPLVQSAADRYNICIFAYGKFS